VNERNMLWNRLRIENAGNIRIEIEDFWWFEWIEKVSAEIEKIGEMRRDLDQSWNLSKYEWNTSVENSYTP
jgi:hypothetical protein